MFGDVIAADVELTKGESACQEWQEIH